MRIRTNSGIYIIASLLWAGPVYAAGDCVADVTKYTQAGLIEHISVFDSHAASGGEVLPSTLEQYGFVDRMKLPNGVEVIYSSGGCAHYGYVFVFQGNAIKPVAPDKKVARAITLLETLPLIRSDERDLSLRALHEVRNAQQSLKETQSVDLPCGDAQCTLIDRDDHRVEISYSFPL